MDITTRIIELISEEVSDAVLKEHEITLDDNLFEDLDIDSLSIIELVTNLEDEFNIENELSELSGILTVRDIDNLIKSKLA